jgi:hypothetical protein
VRSARLAKVLRLKLVVAVTTIQPPQARLTFKQQFKWPLFCSASCFFATSLHRLWFFAFARFLTREIRNFYFYHLFFDFSISEHASA